MHAKKFELASEYIELIKLMKIMKIAATGGHAKILVDSGEVKLNGLIEFRKRAKLRKGDKVVVGDNEVEIV